MAKALNDTDVELAKKAMSDSNLDRKELSSIIEDSIMGRMRSKKTGETLKLDNEVVMAGFRNLLGMT